LLIFASFNLSMAFISISSCLGIVSSRSSIGTRWHDLIHLIPDHCYTLQVRERAIEMVLPPFLLLRVGQR
jgi:hypothetical protein